MTRGEHLALCKKRALQYLQIGEVQNAVASMMSDLTKHPETANLMEGGILGMMGLSSMNSAGEARRYIEGFN